MHYILQFLENIFYNLQLFFFVNAPFAHIFKIALTAQIAFLIYTSFRPSKWKWIVLFISELIFWIGGITISAQGFAANNVFLLVYGVTASVLAVVLFFISLGCSLRKV